MASDSDDSRIEPGPGRLLRARDRGAVAVSPDLVGLGAAAGAIAGLVVSLPEGWSLVRSAATGWFSGAGTLAEPALRQALSLLLSVVGPPMALAMASALVAGLLQTRGHLWGGSGPSPGPSGAFSDGVPWTGLLLSGLKVLLLGLVVGFTVTQAGPAMMGLGPGGLRGVPEAALTLGASLTLGVFGVWVLWGGLDLWLRHRALRQALRLTPQEARLEARETEGDPAFRRHRRHLHRSLLAAEAPEADPHASLAVLGDGPLLVTLRYDRESMPAPEVSSVVRGHAVGSVVEQLGMQGVPRILDPELASRLASLGAGHAIAPSLYEDVARLLLAHGSRSVRG